MLGLESGECLVVEDALSGVVAAHEAGTMRLRETLQRQAQAITI